jgi:hypothetical protein
MFPGVALVCKPDFKLVLQTLAVLFPGGAVLVG